jgi:hypothetical protein
MVLRLALLALLIACRSVSNPTTDGTPASDTAPALDGAIADAPGDSPVDPVDGAPTRRPCTSTFGAALSNGSFGRLDGILVAVVPPGPSSAPCNADTGHVHLQLLVAGAVYDIAVNVGTDDATNDTHSTTLEHALIGPAWAEGWHTGVAVDYPTLGVHADAIPLRTRTDSVNAIMTDLATANHVSVYATGYGPGGAHLVHRNGRGEDGLVVSHPLSPQGHARLFSFTSQTF